MDTIIAVGSNSVTRATLDGKRLNVHTTFEDDASLAQNRRIQDSGLLDKHRLGLHDDADTRAVFSCPSVNQWNLFKRDHPDTYKLLISRNETERMNGARQLSILKPSWVIQSRL